jgi:anaerobic selenocysteine-containing dehydrogenase
VQPKDPGWTGRLDVGNADLLADLVRTVGALGALGALGDVRAPGDDAFPFRLLSRRMMHVYNSSYNVTTTHRGRAYNPLFVHPDDLARLGAHSGDMVDVRSAAGSLRAIVSSDPSMRRGCVSISHAFGPPATGTDDVATHGSAVSALLGFELGFDRYSGQPRMSAIPVDIRASSPRQ